mgnify:CR=1 FL=1
MTRRHRNEAKYPELWAAVDGALRDAVFCHPDIKIPTPRYASIVKRIVGQVLALNGAGAGQAAETREADLPAIADDAQRPGVMGLAHFQASPEPTQRKPDDQD